MENNINTQENFQNIKSSKQLKKTINLALIRFIVCLILFFITVFTKLNNPCKFEEIKFFYQNNFCTEKFTVSEIKEFLKEKTLIIKNKIRN